MSDSKALTIGTTSVRQVGELYSLNDLHTAGGGEPKHQPHEFLRIDQTKALVTELSNSGDSRNYLQTKRGKYGGTYACKELVIAYAAWISAAFHLKVIRVFLTVATPFNVRSGQTLTEEQAATLRNLLNDNVKKLPKEKQGSAMVKGWSKLKAHFKTDYRHIPAAEFHEAVNILARHVSEWEVVDDEQKPAVGSPERLELAFALATEASAQVQRTVFNAVMNDGPDWKHNRYLVSLGYDSVTRKQTAPLAKGIGFDKMIVSVDELPDWIGGGDPITASDVQLANIASACMHRLTKRMQ